jgi:GT2 family glycosyltransferase
MRSSLIIPAHNRASLTRQCLETITADPDVRKHADIVVVDDGSDDDTAESLETFAADIRVVTHGEPTGFARACNDGAVGSRSEYLVFLNNDTIPVAGWLDALLNYADRHPNAAVVGAKLLFPDDTVQHAGMAITEDLNPRHIYAGFPGDHPAVNKSRQCPSVTAACSLFRRVPFEETGGFDDAFKNGFEDVDLCLRLREQGYEVHYCHESVAYHLEMGTRDFRDELANLELYRQRWAHKVRPDAIDRYIEDGLMRIEYGVRYPFSLKLSPWLGIVDDGPREADQLLAQSAARAAELQRENVQLRLLVNEAGLDPPSLALGRAKAAKPRSPRAVLFVSGTYGDAMRYRCDHHAEALRVRGATADARWLHQLPLDEIVEWYECFVLHRVPADEHVEAFIGEVRRRGKTVILDIDEGIAELTERRPDELPAQEQLVGAHRQVAMIASVDAVSVATEPLATLARKFNDRVFVLPNVAGRTMLRLADQALSHSISNRTNDLLLGYVADRLEPNRDFLEAADAVLQALDETPGVRLMVVGELALDRRFNRHRERIQQVPIQPWDRLPALLAKIDINLVPLQAGDPVAEASSCRRWLEAALVATPTIASPRPDFVRAIQTARNGLLAETPKEWHEALEQLIKSEEQRAALGRAAAEDVRLKHTTEAQSGPLYDNLADIAGAAVEGRRLTINWLVGSGGRRSRARVLAELAGELGWRGHRVRLFAASVPSSVRPSVDIRPLLAGSFPPADVSIASDAETALFLQGDSHALFSFFLTTNDDRDVDDDHTLSARPLSVSSADEADPQAFERTLMQRCFARLDPAWKSEDDQ